MLDPVQRALDSVADSAELDWVALEAELSDEQTLSTLHALREIAAIARAHDAPVLSVQRSLPFTWGPLHVREYVARGAHGDVYRAWDPRLEREVALKLLRTEDVDQDEAPFAITEGRLLARVRHPNVVAVYGADRINGQAGIWMELVDGSTVRDLVAQQGPLPPETALEIGMAVCRGLSAVHAAGLVHRDVKAQNVVRDPDGRTILMDLSSGLDDSGVDDRLEGTPVYLAPEVLDGGRATIASDMYAVGVLVFFLLTGRYPLTSSSLDDLRRRHQAGEAERLASDPRVPRALGAAVDRALSSNPADRFESAEAMSAALASAVGSRRRPSALMMAALTCLVIAIGAGGIVLTRGGAGAPWRVPYAAGALVPEEVKPQKIRLPHYEMGMPSSDGATFPYVDEDGHLYLWDVATGRSRRIAEASPAAGVGRTPIISPDGTEVAYGWRVADDAYELRALRSDGTTGRTLLTRETAYEPVPIEWSRDGRWILCWLRQRNGTSDLTLVPAEGGLPKLLQSFPSTESIHATLSPSAQFVLLSAGFNADVSPGLRILDVNDSAPRALIAPVANERLARWTPDGTHVFFLRDSPTAPPSRDAWMVAVESGEAKSDPVLVASDLGAVTSIALTTRGAMYRVLSTVTADVYTAPFDVSGAVPPGPPTRISESKIGNHVGPSWSPDGRTLAYFTVVYSTAGATPRRTLTVQDMVTREARQLSLPLAMVGGYTPRWSPDGRRVIIWGRDGDDEKSFGFFEVDLTTAQMTRVVTLGMNTPAFSQYSLDGQRFFYIDPRRGLVARTLANGEEVVTMPKGKWWALGPFAIAPDGNAIAFIGTTEPHPRQVSSLHVRPINGQSREVARAERPEWITLHAWTPDSDNLLFGRANGTRPYHLWLIPAAGGTPRDMQFSSVPSPSPISLSPDGQRLAYTERVMQHELWTAPAPAAAAAAMR